MYYKHKGLLRLMPRWHTSTPNRNNNNHMITLKKLTLKAVVLRDPGYMLSTKCRIKG